MNKRPCFCVITEDKQILTDLTRGNSNAAMSKGPAVAALG